VKRPLTMGAKECQQSLEAGKDTGKGLSLEPSEGAQPCLCLDFRLLASANYKIRLLL
jgi:hypothetical protein